MSRAASRIACEVDVGAMFVSNVKLESAGYRSMLVIALDEKEAHIIFPRPNDGVGFVMSTWKRNVLISLADDIVN